MAKFSFKIKDVIGPFACSQQFVDSMLAGHENDEVTVEISSLGGRVDHALAIHDAFARQGNVTIDYVGFNASAATFLSLGAKHIKASNTSFYLIHKVLNWVDEFGMLNEDDIDALIQKLEKQKNEQAKITLQLAKMYADKSGKNINDILNLMKEDTWLTAQEAKDWGFVDEVYTPTNAVNMLEDSERLAMIAAAGYPVPTRKKDSGTNQEKEDDLFNRLYGRMKKVFTPNNSKKMKKQFLNVNKVLSVENLESNDDKGVYLNEEQLELLENRLNAVATVEKERDTAQENYNGVVNSLDEIDTTVKEAKTDDEKVNAVRALLAKKPGSKPAGNKSGKDNGGNADDVDWNEIDNLPHNKEADEILLP